MRVLASILITLCLLQNIKSQCPDGTIASVSPPNSGKGTCTNCAYPCATCTTLGACTTFFTFYNGVDRTVTPQTILCSSATIYDSTIGYNKNKDLCDYCTEGCATCVIDYDVCDYCKAGWDLDRKNNKCLRATLGLSAVVLALSALILIIGVITCICACKL